MLIVDRRDLESLSEKDLRKLLRWTCVEFIRRDFDWQYSLLDEISEAIEITGAKYAVEIVELES